RSCIKGAVLIASGDAGGRLHGLALRENQSSCCEQSQRTRRQSVMALEPLLQQERELRVVENASSPQQLISHPPRVALRSQAAMRALVSLKTVVRHGAASL